MNLFKTKDLSINLTTGGHTLGVGRQQGIQTQARQMGFLIKVLGLDRSKF